MNLAMQRIEQSIMGNVGQRLSQELALGLLVTINTALREPVEQSEVVASSVPSDRIVPRRWVYSKLVTTPSHQYTMLALSLDEALGRGIAALHQAHWDETEKYRHDETFNPDYAALRRFEEQGLAVVFGLIDEKNGAMVGNCIMYLARSTHTQQIIAREDTIFVAKAHRKHRMGDAFIAFCHDGMRELGAIKLSVTVKLVNKVGDLLARRHGYVEVAKQYEKKLKEAP